MVRVKRIFGMAMLLVGLTVGAHAAERKANLPEGVIGCLSTSVAGNFDAEMMLLMQSSSGVSVPGHEIMNMLKQHPELEKGAPYFEMMVGGFFGLDDLKHNPAGRLQIIMLEEKEKRSVCFAASIPLFSFDELLQAMESGENKRLSAATPDKTVLRLEPERDADIQIPVYIAGVEKRAILVADNPEILPRARDIFDSGKLPRPGGGVNDGFAVDVTIDLSSHLGKLVFATTNMMVAEARMANQGDASPIRYEILQTFFGLGGESKAMFLSGSLKGGVVSFRGFFVPETGSELKKGMDAVVAQPKPKTFTQAASLPRETSAFLQWEGSEATLRILTRFLGSVDFFADDAIAKYSMQAFMKKVTRGSDNSIVSSGITSAGEVFLCISPMEGIIESTYDSSFMNMYRVDKIAVSKEKDRALFFFHPNKERDMDALLRDISEGKDGLGARSSFPTDVLGAARGRVLAIGLCYLPELMGAAFSGKGIFGGGGDAEADYYARWFRKKMRSALKDYKMESRHPIAAIAEAVDGGLSISATASIGMLHEMVNLYQHMAGGVTPFSMQRPPDRDARE